MTTMSDLQVITTPEELEKLDPDTVLIGSCGEEVFAYRMQVSIESLGNESLYYDSFPAAVIATGDRVRVARETIKELSEETWEYQVQTRTQRMPTWVAITDDTLQKWYPEDKYNDLIRKKRVVRGGAGLEIRVLCRRVSEPEVVNE